VSQMQLANKTALITGAGSGIGRGITQALAKRGCNVIITDINEAGLLETESIIAPHQVEVTRHILDVSDRETIQQIADTVASKHGQIDLLINNAGVALGGTFEQVTEADFNWLFTINFHGVVWMTRTFFPLLKQSPDARIVNISSLFGIIAPPGQVAYCSAKFAVRGFSEALRHELVGSTIGVTVVHPGGINTNIVDNSRTADAGYTEEEIQQQKETYKKSLVMPPEQAGEIIVNGIINRKDRVLVGNDAKLVAFITRLFPTRYWNIIKRFVPD